MLEQLVQDAFTQQEVEARVEKYATIVQHPDTGLQTPCVPCDLPYIESGELFPMALMMQSHLEKNGGIGLAANQVGGRRRIIMLRYENTFTLMINPEIGLRRGHRTIVEKCLSVGEGYTPYAVKRAKTISVRFDTFREVDGEAVLGQASKTIRGLEAVVFQHEVDHLNGLSIVDKGKLVSEPNKELA